LLPSLLDVFFANIRGDIGKTIALRLANHTFGKVIVKSVFFSVGLSHPAVLEAAGSAA